VHQRILIQAKDSLFSQDKIAQIQALSFEESMRQQNIALAKEQEAEERKTNIQYGIVAIGLVCLLVVFLLLSNSVIINGKWIRFLGILGLLLVFEFLNLIFHGFIAKITHHSPIWMLLIMVALASVLIPFHHKIEHWVSDKVVAKNKRILIAAAKRTLEKLEGTADVGQNPENDEP